ncbi:protein toll-like [Uloborus diversus]|uniref:protein toll-like n=1 Tax=Uloborus diversus TaxID=327109 RepID=UPI0024092C72|nr:protein toll-like [Uloborus diversus]
MESVIVKLSLLVMNLFLFSYTECKSDETTTEHYNFPKEKCENLLPTCACYDYEVVVGLECENLTDFSNFTILSNGGLFKVNTTYEITLESLESLPAKSMNGLIVFRLYLDDPNIADIDSEAFDGVIRLRIFHVRRSSIKQIPNFKVIKDSLRDIHIENSLLISLHGTALQGLYLLDTVSFVNNSISSIDVDAFKGTDGVLIFDVSYNKLQFLPPTLFDSWKNLRKVVLSHNQLLHVDQLFAVTRPKFIYLDYNNLTNLDGVLYPNMTSVETLLLANNPFDRVSEMSFNGKIPNVRFIYLYHCKITEFDVRHYKGLDTLATLDLSYNLITKISNQTVDFGKNLELKFYGNQIKEFEAELTYKVRRLYIQDNNLDSLDRTLQFTQVAEVSVARNRLQFLSQQDFRGVHGMINVELQGNKVQWIDSRTFWNIRNDLHYLDLSGNLIRALNGSVRYLSQLKSLNLTQNLLQSFQEGEFTGLNELAELYIEHNQLVALGGQLQRVPQLQYLVVRNNRIHTLDPKEIPKRLQYLYMADNPFRCDCQLSPFLRWLTTTDSLATDMVPCLPLNGTHMNTSVVSSCPHPCSCSCTEDGGAYFMTLDCSFQNMSVFPSFLLEKKQQPDESANTSSIVQDEWLEFYQSGAFEFQIHDRLLGINLEGNNFRSLEHVRLPVQLRHLRLANNKIRRVPDSLLDKFHSLTKATFSGNQWECDCEILGFKKWLLSKSDVVEDNNMTFCSSNDAENMNLDRRKIYTLTDLDLCPLNIMLYLSIALVLTFLLMCAAMKIVYTRYELNIKVWLFSHGITCVKEKDIDRDKCFEAFISFCHKDFDLVHGQIIRVIKEKRPDVRLCLHYCHFVAGEFIDKNIFNAVKLSKRTILMLSENYLESEWCLMEFRAADMQSQKDKINRIIVVKLGDLPKNIDPAIKMYMDNTTYLNWGDKYFWNNLFYVLPGPEKNKNIITEAGNEMKGPSMYDSESYLI